MSSKLIIPFNYQPFSVSVKTGAYTIPAGYYAYVTASVQGADTFSIGGVVALAGVAGVAGSGTGGASAEVDTSATNTTAIFTYTVPAGYYFYYNSFTTGYPATGVSYEIETYINSQTTSSGHNVAYRSSTGSAIVYSPAPIAPGGVAGVYNGIVIDGQQGPYGAGTIIGVDINNTSSLLKRITGTIIRPNSLSGGQSAVGISGSFWVSENTALTTSGGSYTVTLYPNIS